MSRLIVGVMFAAVTLSGCTRATPEQQIIRDAAEAIGGAQKIEGIKTLVIEGEGTNGNLGQDMTPDATGQTFTVTGYRRAMDIGTGRFRVQQTRTPNFAYFQGQQAQKQIFGLDGNVAYNVAANGTATRAAETVARDRRAEVNHHPLTILRAALNPGAKLSNPRTANNEIFASIASSRFTAPSPRTAI
jgi:hypothetical protein